MVLELGVRLGLGYGAGDLCCCGNSSRVRAKAKVRLRLGSRRRWPTSLTLTSALKDSLLSCDVPNGPVSRLKGLVENIHERLFLSPEIGLIWVR